jgi:hypothetical protein
MRNTINACKILNEKPDGKNNLKELTVDGAIIIKSDYATD